MKRKILSLALASAMVVGLVACGNDGNAGNGSTPAGSTENSTPAGSTEGSTAGGDTSVAPPAPSNGGEPIKDLVTYETANRELEGWMIQNTEKAQDLNVLCNAYSGLLEVNNRGQLQPAVATEWGTEDGGLTWTFKLRDDVTWVDVDGNYMADCTAKDWLTALEWILNFQKNGGMNTSMANDMIVGAEEYYNFTKELAEKDPAAANALTCESPEFADLVGIEAPDDYTLIYHCSKNVAYFDTLCTSACLYPLSQALVDKMGIENMVGISNRDMWYNGPYTVPDFVSGNQKVLKANPAYWDKSASLFDTVTIIIAEDGTTDDQLFQTGEIDNCDLNEATLSTIYNAGESNEYYANLVESRPKKYSYQMHFNFDKRDADGNPDTNWNTAVANLNFRLSLYYGMDLTNYWARTNKINPSHCENLAYTMSGLLTFSDNTDYTSRVIQELGISPAAGGGSGRYDPEKAAEYRDKAIEELTAKGVTFPVQMDYYVVAGSQSALDTATVLKEIVEAIGEDYVTLNIGTFVSSLNKEVVVPKLHSFVINGWGADYGDVENFIGQELYGYDSAYYSMHYSYINDATDPDLIADYKEFTELGVAASEIYDDLDKRYEAYAKAEVYLLEHAFTIPMSYEVSWQLTRINDYSKMNALYGIQNYMYKNWETSTVPYTTAEYEQFKADFESGN